MNPLHALKHRAVSAYEREVRINLAEEIARQIMLNVIGPGTYCTDEYCADHVRYRQAQADAALARDIGSGKRPAHIQAAEPGCSPSVRAAR